MDKIKLDKKDTDRVLLTDTYPSDVPIIFSNDGFYINTKKIKIKPSGFQSIKKLYTYIICPNDESAKLSQSNPFKYKIVKNSNQLRTLSLLHPRAQNNFVWLYKHFADQICYQCKLSPFSIRSPNSINNSLFSIESSSHNKYKEVSIDTLESQLVNKHASSFFAYRGYKRIHMFYNSTGYLELEKMYPHMVLLDVANCFDTIYTHTITWSIKNKNFAKNNKQINSQFGNKFDTLMQRSR